MYFIKSDRLEFEPLGDRLLNFVFLWCSLSLKKCFDDFLAICIWPLILDAFSIPD